MKFKKIEIQAFRAYDKVENATFDFQLETKDYADFVSIYAPNGFGKTSFYDAVEWGFTNNILRFLKRDTFNKEVSKSEKNLNSSIRQYILRNRQSRQDLPGFVKLFTTNLLNPIVSNIPQPRKGGSDYKFDEKQTVRGYFQEVILSQDWIDSFLREDSGNERYTKFIEYFGDKDLDLYYKQIIALIHGNDDNIKLLEKEILGLELDLKFDGDDDILKEINFQISKLDRKSTISPITRNFTEQDEFNLSNAIAKLKNSLSFDIERKKNLSDHVGIAFSGSAEVPGVEIYFQTLNKLGENDKETARLKAHIERCDQKERIVSERASLIKRKALLIVEKEYIEKLLTLFPKFQYILVSINKSNSKIESLKKQVSQSENKLLQFRTLSPKLSDKLNVNQKKINKLKSDLQKFPFLKRNILKLENEIDKLSKAKVKIENKIEDAEQSKVNNEIELKSLRALLTSIKKDNYLPLAQEEYSEYKELVARIERAKNYIVEFEAQLSQINNTINQQKSLSKDIEQFVSKGLEIVNKTQSRICPLCSENYNSVASLAERITKNKSLSQIFQTTLQQRNSIAINILNSEEDIKIDKSILLKSINRKINFIQKRLSIDVALILKNKKLLSKLNTTISANSKKLTILENVISGFSMESYRLNIKSQIEDLEHLNDNIKRDIKINKENITKENSNCKILKQNILTINQSISSISKDDEYLQIISFRNTHYPKKAITEELIINHLSKIKGDLNKNIADEIRLSNNIEQLDKLLTSLSLESAKMKVKSLNSDKTLLLMEIKKFEEFIKVKLHFTIGNSDKKSLSNKLNSIVKENRSEIENNEKLIEQLSLIEKLSKNILPFLKYESAKIIQHEKEARIGFLREIVKVELEKEKLKVSDYLDKQINSFFYEDLINLLYKKIDPHPEYTKIKFKCDFSEEKPQLNVCVLEMGKEELLIPNLYFSTAQLNILSLCIFLAKALNVTDELNKPLDCIFLDDPIQTMDSINILSTIDLLRSIVANNKKQIILSTHDENFYYLLKKKIPKELFKAKFIELETYGKIKKS